MKKAVLIAGFLAFCLSLALVAKEKAKLPEKIPFDVQQVKPALPQALKASPENPSIVRISGQIVAGNKSSLAFKVPGFISSIDKKPGDVLKKGEVLARLEAMDFNYQVELMKLNKEQAALSEKVAKNEFQREEQLKAGNVSTASQFDLMEAKFKQASVATKLAEVNLHNAERNLARTKLVAPYDCVVAAQYKDEAEHVGTETKVFDVYAANSTEIHLNVPESFIGRLKNGAKLSVSIPAVNYVAEASITKVVPAISETTRTFKVIAKFKENDARIVPGLFVEAQLQ